METQEVKHIQVNGRYRVVIERIGSAKGIVGIKVESNGDGKKEALDDAIDIFNEAKSRIPNEIV